MSVVIKYPVIKQPKDKRVYLMWSSRWQSPISRKSRQELAVSATSHPRAEIEWMNECMHTCWSASFLSSDTIQGPKPGNGAAHGGSGHPTSMKAIKIIPHRPPWFRRFLGETFFQMVLDCIKLIIETNHHGWPFLFLVLWIFHLWGGHPDVVCFPSELLRPWPWLLNLLAGAFLLVALQSSQRTHTGLN